METNYNNITNLPNASKKSQEPKEPEVRITKPIASISSGQHSNKILGLLDVADINKVKTYAWQEVIRPGVKSALLTVLGMFFKVDIRPTNNSVLGNRVTNTPYHTYSKNNNRRILREDPTALRTGARPLIFDTKEKLDLVLSGLAEVLRLHNNIRVLDLYSISDYYKVYNITPDYTDSYRGWYSLENFHAQRRIDGSYELIVPEPSSIA